MSGDIHQAESLFLQVAQKPSAECSMPRLFPEGSESTLLDFIFHHPVWPWQAVGRVLAVMPF